MITQQQETEPVISLFPKTNTLVMASGTKRFLNFVIDYIAAIIFGIIAMATLVIICELLGYDTTFLEGPVVDRLIWVFWYFSYATFFEVIVNGKTIGKMITKTRVVDEDGNKPSVRKIMGRSLARMIPFDAFSFLGEEARGWHDSLSGTVVIDEQKSVLRPDWV